MQARSWFLLVAVALLAVLARSAAAGSDPDDRDDLVDDSPEHGDRGERADDAAESPGGRARVAGPRVGEVVGAAYRAAGIDRNRARGWSRRARVAGLIPWVTVRTGRNTSWQDSDPDVDRGTTIEVRATWRLDRLVFDSRELQAASIDAARHRERQRLASRVIRAYFHWQRVARATGSLRAEEAAAELDALTDGWFSDELARRRGRASGRGD